MEAAKGGCLEVVDLLLLRGAAASNKDKVSLMDSSMY